MPHSVDDTELDGVRSVGGTVQGEHRGEEEGAGGRVERDADGRTAVDLRLDRGEGRNGRVDDAGDCRVGARRQAAGR